MRDYSFGNFISELRMRKGLSQFQLGSLVGVSDKAVSKWENGITKPSINNMGKLSRIFNITMDELLACEYDAFNKKGKDLFAMKRTIMNKVMQRAEELYGKNMPLRIRNRIKTEEIMMAKGEKLLWLGFLGELHTKFLENGAYFDLRGAGTGESFIGWLLGGTNANPLPPHYYCPQCKRVEFVSGIKCGIDLPDKMCDCGHVYNKYGFGLDEIFMYPFDSGVDIYVSNNATELVRGCVKEYFAEYGDIREIKILTTPEMDHDTASYLSSIRFALLPKGMENRFKDQVVEMDFHQYIHETGDLSIMTVIESKEETLSFSAMKNIEITQEVLEGYYKYSLEHGIFKEYEKEGLEKVLADIKKPSFNDLIILRAFLHDTGAWEDNARNLYDEGIPIKDMISCREDVYTCVYDKLKGTECENPVGIAFEIKRSVRRGKYSFQKMPEEIEQILIEAEVPKWYIESMKKIQYLMPKSHLIHILKREICNWYLNNRE